MICDACYVEKKADLKREFERIAEEIYEEYLNEQRVDLEEWEDFTEEEGSEGDRSNYRAMFFADES